MDSLSNKVKFVLIIAVIIITIGFIGVSKLLYLSLTETEEPKTVSLNRTETVSASEVTSTGFSIGMLQLLYQKGDYYIERYSDERYDSIAMFRNLGEYEHSIPVTFTVSKMFSPGFDLKDYDEVKERMTIGGEISSWYSSDEYYVESCYDQTMDFERAWILQIIPKENNGRNHILIICRNSYGREMIDEKTYKLVQAAIFKGTGFLTPEYEDFKAHMELTGEP